MPNFDMFWSIALFPEVLKQHYYKDNSEHKGSSYCTTLSPSCYHDVCNGDNNPFYTEHAGGMYIESLTEGSAGDESHISESLHPQRSSDMKILKW